MGAGNERTIGYLYLQSIELRGEIERKARGLRVLSMKLDGVKGAGVCGLLAAAVERMREASDFLEQGVLAAQEAQEPAETPRLADRIVELAQEAGISMAELLGMGVVEFSERVMGARREDEASR